MTYDDYPLWQDCTAYEHVLVVDQAHPQAHDDNPGTASLPLRSIQAALERVQPKGRVCIHAGIYREQLIPRRGGSGCDAMISIEAAPGEEVILRGSQILEGEWTRPRPWDVDFGLGQKIPCMAQSVWRIDLPTALQERPDNPFAHPNVADWEEKLMPWMEPVSGRPPFLLRRGMLFQEGQRLTQLHHHGDIPRVPGSFWVEENATALLVHPLDSRNPEHCQFEITYQSQLLCPEQVGLDFIRLSGLRFEHCGNSFLRASAGAVSTRGGSHWIIEDCSFNQINSAGLEFSDYPFENKDPHPANPGHKWRGSGHVIVRRNTFSHCGTAGIRCLGVSEGRVLDNVVTDCGWQEAEYYYECAGIKLLLTRHTLVAGNRIRHLRGACGIWMDFNNQRSRVSANYISDIDSIQGGIFIEASLVENRIDHNVIWRIDGPGIFGGDSSRQIYEQNIIGHTTAVAMSLFCHTDRTVDGQPVACIENVVRHNLFVAVPGHRADEDNNIFQGNAYVHSHTRDWSAWQKRGFDADAHYAIGQMQVDCESLCLRWQLSDGDPIPQHIGALTLRGRQGEAQFA